MIKYFADAAPTEGYGIRIVLYPFQGNKVKPQLIYV